eukprot:7466194-Alexandrium_andersonii.AAC.1
MQRLHVSQATGQRMPIALSGRDLGSHVSYGAVRHAITMNMRVDRACAVCARLGTLPAMPPQKQRAVRMKVLPMALLQWSVPQCGSDPQRKLASAIKTCLK